MVELYSITVFGRRRASFRAYDIVNDLAQAMCNYFSLDTFLMTAQTIVAS